MVYIYILAINFLKYAPYIVLCVYKQKYVRTFDCIPSITTNSIFAYMASIILLIIVWLWFIWATNNKVQNAKAISHAEYTSFITLYNSYHLIPTTESITTRILWSVLPMYRYATEHSHLSIRVPLALFSIGVCCPSAWNVARNAIIMMRSSKWFNYLIRQFRITDGKLVWHLLVMR